MAIPSRPGLAARLGPIGRRCQRRRPMPRGTHRFSLHCHTSYLEYSASLRAHLWPEGQNRIEVSLPNLASDDLVAQECDFTLNVSSSMVLGDGDDWLHEAK